MEIKLGNATWKCLNVNNSNQSDENRFNDTSIVIKLEIRFYIFLIGE